MILEEFYRKNGVVLTVGELKTKRGIKAWYKIDRDRADIDEIKPLVPLKESDSLYSAKGNGLEKLKQIPFLLSLRNVHLFRGALVKNSPTL